jgi:hypothetical protein
MRRVHSTTRSTAAVLSCLGIAVATMGCSAGNEDGAGAAGGAGGQGGGFGETAATTSTGTEGCTGISSDAELKDLHLYVMVDASNSMAGTKWEAAKQGLESFVTAPQSAGLDVALSFFPRPADGVPECDQNAYKAPVVDFGLLPANAQALVDAMAARSPDGFSSPMYPALGGAILASIELADSFPDDAFAVLLVTDGKPDGPGDDCGGVDPSLPESLATLAQSGANYTPRVPTFVVGLPGIDLTFANLVAEAGGTTEAIVVGTTNTASKFAEALERVRGSAVSCRYVLPLEVANGAVGPDFVNVEVTAGDGSKTTLSYSEGCASSEGWSFDDPMSPTEIVICSASCDAVSQDFDAKLTIVLGCPTVF